MNIDELIRYAWNNGMSSYHDTKTSKQLKVEEDNFMDSIEDELKKLRVADVIKNEVAVCGKKPKLNKNMQERLGLDVVNGTHVI